MVSSLVTARALVIHAKMAAARGSGNAAKCTLPTRHQALAKKPGDRPTLAEDQVLTEPTAGNTGIALAALANAQGTPIELAVPGGREHARLSFTLPLHVAERNALATGEVVVRSIGMGTDVNRALNRTQGEGDAEVEVSLNFATVRRVPRKDREVLRDHGGDVDDFNGHDFKPRESPAHKSAPYCE